MAQYYDDIGKTLKDMFEKGFIPKEGIFKITSETKVEEAQTSTGSCVVTAALPSSVASVERKIQFPAHGVEGSFKLATSGDFEATVTKNELGHKNVEGKVTVSQANSKKTSSVKAGLTFRNDVAAVKLDGEKPISGGGAIIGTASSAFVHDEWSGGISVNYSVDGKPATAVNPLWALKMAYTRPNFMAMVAVDNQVDKETKSHSRPVGLSFFHSINDDTRFAAKIEQDTMKAGFAPNVTGVVEHQFDRYTSIKDRVHIDSERNARVSIGLKQVVSKMLTVTVCADLNANKIHGYAGGKDHALGIELSFK